jgi:hypothetical protein
MFLLKWNKVHANHFGHAHLSIEYASFPQQMVDIRQRAMPGRIKTESQGPYKCVSWLDTRSEERLLEREDQA